MDSFLFHYMSRDMHSKVLPVESNVVQTCDIQILIRIRMCNCLCFEFMPSVLHLSNYTNSNCLEGDWANLCDFMWRVATCRCF